VGPQPGRDSTGPVLQVGPSPSRATCASAGWCLGRRGCDGWRWSRLPLRREAGRPMRVLGGGSLTLPAVSCASKTRTSFSMTPGLSVVFAGRIRALSAQPLAVQACRVSLMRASRPRGPGTSVSGPRYRTVARRRDLSLVLSHAIREGKQKGYRQPDGASRSRSMTLQASSRRPVEPLREAARPLFLLRFPKRHYEFGAARLPPSPRSART